MPQGPVSDHKTLHCDLFKKIEGIPGDIFEFGVFDGGTTRQLAGYGRTVWAFDTYEGMPKEEFSAEKGDHDVPGKFPSSAPPEELFKGYDNIIPVKGRFIKTLPTIASDVKAAFVYMDCDLYESYRQVLEWLPDHLVEGAIVHVDDYGACAGCKLAMHEWFEKTGLAFANDQRWFVWPSKK